ncbi:aminotransferase class III-fold pyridoxal phosphate-dependent enzyme [Lipingzhangella halophila]
MAEVKQRQFLVDRAEGAWIYDREGGRYLDATAALWYCNVGHGRAEIADAVAAQLRRLDAYFVFNDFTNEPAERLAHRLSELAPMPDARIFLTSGGGDSIDTAVKLARRYWIRQGSPERVHILSRRHSYHGTHGLGTSIGGIDPNREGYGPLIEGTSRVAHDDIDDLRTTIDRIGADKIAAFFCEPVIGAGGVRPPQPGYLEAAAEICAEHGILFVADAVICGFGRLGGWFGVERWNLTPDMITFAKGVTSGYVPLGGVAVAGWLAEPFWEGDGGSLPHGQTYSGHPTAAASALANLDILERENLLARADALERPLYDALRTLHEHPAVGDVRGGVGLLGAVELAPEVLGADTTAPARVARAARERGVIVRPLATALAVSPPLTVTEDEIALIPKAVAEALDAVVG